MAEVTTHSLLVSSPKHHPVTSLRLYGRDIPQALHDLSQLLLDAPATTDGDQAQDPPASQMKEPTGPVETEVQDPVQGQVKHHQQESPSNQFPVVIAPMGYTRTGHQPGLLMQLVTANSLSLQTFSPNWHPVCLDFHPFARLWAFASTIAQPDGYPDAMPLNVALQQPDLDKFIHAMARELEQHTKLKHWKIIHKSQVPKNAIPIPMVWTLQRKQDPAGEILKCKARLCARGHHQV